MPWRPVRNVFERSTAEPKGITLEAEYNEATAGGLRLAVLRLTRALGHGANQQWNGFHGFRCTTDTTLQGTVVRSASIDPDKQITFFSSDIGEGYALVPVGSEILLPPDQNGNVRKEYQPRRKNLDILIDSMAYNETNWEILCPVSADILAEVEAAAKIRRKALQKQKPAVVEPVKPSEEDELPIKPADEIEALVKGKKG
jgi:hypothetical protein